MSRQRGNQPTFDQAIADEILSRIADGETLRQICRDKNMPAESTVRSWALHDYDGFGARYARARDLQVEAWADESIEIADDATNDWVERETSSGRTEVVADRDHISRSRLRVDQRKWLMSKWKPSTYGDKITHSSDPENPMPDGAGTAVTKLADAIDRLASRRAE